MSCGCEPSKQDKIMYSAIYAAAFLVVSNPVTYRVVSKILGSRIAGPSGCPSKLGLVVHTLVFFIVIYALMNVSPKPECPVIAIE